MRLGARFVETLGPGSVVAMHGELGSGKTCFVRGMAEALGIPHAITSPTFTLIQEYRGRRWLYHIDLYRLKSPDELLNIGFEEYLESDGIVVVEWAEHAAEVLPAGTVHVFLRVLPKADSREITIERPPAPPPPATGA